MSRMHVVVRGALLLGATAVVYACNSDADVLGPLVNPLFNNYVAIGNSITAGFQSDGINDSTQRQSYALLLAKQMGTRYGYAALQMPGCRPPLNNFHTQTRVTLPGQPASTATTCALRDPNSVTAYLNNVAVPGITVSQPTIPFDTNSTVLWQLILGGETMVQKALDARPTFATVWVGNNDVLSYAVTGQPAGATSQASFAASYSQLIRELIAGAPKVKGVLIGVVQVTNAPILFTSQALLNPQFVGGLSVAAGTPIAVDPATCTPTNTSLIGLPIVTAIRAGQLPPVIACAKTPTPPIGDIFVLDAAEQVQVKAIIDGYNTFIKAKADSIGFAYYDPNTTLARLATIDPVLASHVPNLASATATFGQFVTLDGVHPSAASHVQITNDLIAVINAKYGTNLAAIPTT
jgi:GDSL-like Lipase/Acylhydrolase